jgi:hypothetical protein
MVQAGDSVVYVDPTGREFPALVTAVWPKEYAGTDKPGVNLVFVSASEADEDSYGRQIKRETSLVHQSVNPTGRQCWRER